MMEEGEIPRTYGVWTEEDYRPSKRRVFLLHSSSSCAAEQFHSDESLEAMDRRAPKNWQWMTEGDVSVRRSTLAPHGVEWLHSFLQTVGSTLLFYYRCTKVGFVNLSTSAAPQTAQGYLYTGSPSRQTIETASAVGSWALSQASWLARSCLFRWITVQFVGPWWPRSC